ncbi:MAG: hypothetical protein Q8Q62_15300, partial [Mesorhizobium sp.]|nr:hypothetical protein [Mesorhizobium sp.]
MDQTLSADAGPGFRKILIYCLVAYLASRGALTLIGVAAQTFILPLLPPGSYRWHEGVAPWLDVWGAWDSGWFTGIVEGGYMTTPITEPASD